MNCHSGQFVFKPQKFLGVKGAFFKKPPFIDRMKKTDPLRSVFNRFNYEMIFLIVPTSSSNAESIRSKASIR